MTRIHFLLILAPLVVALSPGRALAGGSPAPAFADAGFGLLGLWRGATAFGDFDNDGDLDLAVIGADLTHVRRARLYRNQSAGAVFTDSGLLPASAAVQDGDLGWCDYDRDGDLDLAILGESATGNIARIYRNDGGSFTDIAAPLQPLSTGALAWGDVDLDGDPDLLLVGADAGVLHARLYRNTAGAFSLVPGTSLQGLQYAHAGWCDVDDDGDPDLLLTGEDATFTPVCQLYRNDAGSLVAVASGLSPTSRGEFDFADADNDGDMDVLKTGYGEAVIWLNNGTGSFTASGQVLQGGSSFGAAWADMDHDGWSDFVMGGETGSIGLANVHRSLGAGAYAIHASLPDLSDADFDWGDIDRDGDLDLALMGLDFSGSPVWLHRIYRASGGSTNAAPTAPSGLALSVGATHVTFSWAAASDPETPPQSLSYNLWAGTAPGVANVVAPMADLATGLLKISRPGNRGRVRSLTLPRSAFGAGAIHWGVQAVDQSFLGGPFATGPSAVLGVVESPVTRPIHLRYAGAHPSVGVSAVGFDLPSAGTVTLEVLDVHGRRVRMLKSGELTPGAHVYHWDGRSNEGAAVAPGLYLVRLRAAGRQSSLRLVVRS